ncbi:MAG: FAD-dependent oxidoreductase [Symploca sp. SIO2B6]|nr:FAD-dependent oxidoreductase [Symploca sp. SIO2B6]
MLKTVFNLPNEQQQKIGIIGAGAMGVSTACILARLGIAQITIFEAESKPFNNKGASSNNTGILHHFVYGGHQPTLEYFFKQSIFFEKLMPEYVFGDRYINYLVPNERGNTAINEPDINFKDIATYLVDIYQGHLKIYPNENFLGPVNDLVKILDKDMINALFCRTNLSQKKIAGGVKIRQSVLNIGEYICHMINLLELVSRHNLVTINYHHKVNNIRIKEQNFELNINENNLAHFDTVINAGYATGLEIPIPTPRNKEYIEGNLVKLKVYGLYKIPLNLKLQLPELKNFSSTILIRGQYGGIIQVGTDILAVFSGQEYNQDEWDFPLSESSINIPKEWLQNREQIMGKTEVDITKSIKYNLAEWIPWAKELEDIKLKKAIQVYPRRKPTNDLEAAQRDDNPVRYMYQHKNGGKYIHIPGFKLTSIPYQAFQVVLEILSIYIQKGILSQKQVNQHIILDSNRQIILSPEMEYALGKDLKQSAISEREKIIKEWDIY